MSISDNLNLSIFTDYYSFATANGFLREGIGEKIAWFDLIFRKNPNYNGFAIVAGLQEACEYLSKLKFSEDDIELLRSNGMDEDFLDYLRDFKFTCDVWAIPEGTPVFPGEPVIKVRGPMIQAQLIETILQLTINHSTVIATKANKIVRAAAGRRVVEFGVRKAHGPFASLYGSRAAYIGGCNATTSTIASKEFGIPLFVGMNHSFIQMFDNELDAFRAYSRCYPDNCVLLIDTFDCMNSGLKNAIKVFNEIILPLGFRPKGVRIDSGDLTYLSKNIRRELNDAGFPDCDIIVSNSLDEYIIREMLQHGARADAFLCGERLVTPFDKGAFGGAYRLVAVDSGEEIEPKLRIYQNVSKIAAPCSKLVWRLFDNETGKAIADVLTLEDEDLGKCSSYELFDPDYTRKRKTVDNFVARQLLVPIFINGECIYKFPSLDDIRSYCAEQVDALWEEVLRFENPHGYYVDMSQDLWEIRQELITKTYE